MLPSTRVLPYRDATFWALRALRSVTIPEGAERIWNHWFWGCGVEEVHVPTSVKIVENEAFARCTRLRLVEFAEDSRLESICWEAFYGSGL